MFYYCFSELFNGGGACVMIYMPMGTCLIKDKRVPYRSRSSSTCIILTDDAFSLRLYTFVLNHFSLKKTTADKLTCW